LRCSFLPQNNNGDNGRRVKEQTKFAGFDWAVKKMQTKREKLLSVIDRVMPWDKPVGLIEPHYPKASAGRRPTKLERMVRLYSVRQ
jgi:IS5 family transposase